jgi:hypothetical protein
MEELDKFVHSSLAEYLKDRIVSLGAGTGNLFKVGDRSFIVTCRHVAKGFFRLSFSCAILRDNFRIPKDHLHVAAQTDDEIDIAVIEIDGPYTARGSFTLADVELVGDFSTYDLSKSNIILSGYPSDIGQRDDQGLLYRVPMTFMTRPHRSIQQTADYFYCEYPTATDVLENPSGRELRLPAALGLSGSFMLKVSEFEGPKYELWQPSLAKVLAVQQSWDKSSWVKGSNVKHLIALLRDQLKLNVEVATGGV